MELAPTHQSGHLVASLELFKADDALSIVTIFVHAEHVDPCKLGHEQLPVRQSRPCS